MSFHLSHPVDFSAHNAEVERVWKAYEERRPYRVPVRFSASITNLLCNPELNEKGWTFRQFFEDPQVQIDARLAFDNWWVRNVVGDHRMGPPEEGWQTWVDFQNSYEAGWFGCPLKYCEGVVPDTEPILRERKEKLYDLEPPDPLRGGLLGRAMELFERMHELCPRMEFQGLPVLPPCGLPGEITDGVFTVACLLRGTTEFCMDIMEDPGYAHDLMRFVTENTIRRIRAIQQWRWERLPDSPDAGQVNRPNWGFADDGIVVLSVPQYREFVLPYHRQLAAEFSDGTPLGMHLCGDASRFFPVMHEELGVGTFNTGFPMPFAEMRRRLGPDVAIEGGVPVPLLKSGPPDAIREEVKRICGSGVMAGGRFVMVEACNMSPGTPVEHVEAMYEAAKQYGRYQ